MSRFKAASIHLVLSALIALAMLILVFGIWYPGGYYQLLGVSNIYFILMGVDVALGPLLTLAVYKAGKKGLKFDLAIIAAVQIAALLYGANVVFKSRPVFNVFEDDVFKVVLASEMNAKNLAQASKPEWQKLSIFGPALVAATGPTAVEDKNAMIFQDWSAFPKLYISYESRKHEAFKHAKPLTELKKLSTENSQIIDAFLNKANRPVSDFIYFPIVHSFVGMTAVLDAKNADFMDIINIDTPD
ncbi:MAG: TfpX/TfpZ family type IV pilin accessory protein [Methylophilaceae bacterium]